MGLDTKTDWLAVSRHMTSTLSLLVSRSYASIETAYLEGRQQTASLQQQHRQPAQGRPDGSQSPDRRRKEG
jgi:hypothetical protein